MVEDDIRLIKAIDAHSHLNHGAKHDSLGNDPCLYKADYGFLRRMYDRTNIALAVFSTFAAVLSAEETVEENEFLFDFIKREDAAYGYAVIDPRNRRTFAQADEMLAHPKCLGIKIVPTYHGYDIKQYGDEIFSFAAARRAVILIHPTGCYRDECGFADKYHDTTLILAHLGSRDHVSAIEHAVNGNVYTDTSGYLSCMNNVVEYAVERVGSTRILFGTDTYAAGFQRGRIEYADISHEDKENILRNNALRLFKGKIKE